MYKYKQLHLNEKDLLKNNLARLLEKYSRTLARESEAAKALLAVVSNGKKMLTDMENIHIGFFPDEIVLRNYRIVMLVYKKANAVMENLLSDDVNLDQLSTALNQFSQVTDEYIESKPFSLRFGATVIAFTCAFGIFVGLYGLALAVCPPFALMAGIGTLAIAESITFSLMGISMAAVGIIGTVRWARHASDCEYKSSQRFKNTLFSFKQKLHPAPAEQGADHIVQPHI